MTTARATMAELRRIAGPDLGVHPERCVLVRNRNARCLRCVEACTSGAIGANDDGLSIDPRLCIGCGTCATVCPTGALEALSPDDQALSKAAAALARACGGTVTIACSHAITEAVEQGLVSSAQAADGRSPGDPGAAGQGQGSAPLEATAGWVEVACLGRVDVTCLVELAVRGARRVVFAPGDCLRCPHAAGIAVLADTLRDAGNLLATFGANLALELPPASKMTAWPPAATDGARTTQAPGDEAGAAEIGPLTLRELARLPKTAPELARAASDVVARREGFEDGRYLQTKAPGAEGAEESEGAEGAQESEGVEGSASVEGPADPEGEDAPRPPRVGANGVLPQFVPTRRTRLFNCLKALGAPRADQEPLATGLWGTVSIDAALCDGCRMCAVFCPTGALRRTPEGAPTFGVTHQPTFCVQCGTCEATCPHQAIELSCAVEPRTFLRGTKTTLEMHEPDWKPNRPDSIYRKVFGLLGEHNNLAVY